MLPNVIMPHNVHYTPKLCFIRHDIMPLSVHYTPPKGLYNKTQISCLGNVHHLLEKMDRAMGREGKKKYFFLDPLVIYHPPLLALLLCSFDTENLCTSFFNLSL